MAVPQNKSPVDEAAISKNLAELEKRVDALLPHVNKANSAFGGLDDQVTQLQGLKGQIQKARAIYGA